MLEDRRSVRGRIPSAGRPFPGASGVRGWLHDETGGISLFIVITLLLMLAIGGMGADLMRHEMLRADLQNALDRGVLAAANAQQGLGDDPDEAARELVVSYLASRNYRSIPVNLDVRVTPLTGGRRVTATAGFEMGTVFMRLLGQPQLPVATAAGAEQRETYTEIALVLDISGSMTSPLSSGCTDPGVTNCTKLAELRTAAKNFVNKVLAADKSGKTLISVIPYSEQVAIPPGMASTYGMVRDHAYSTCIDFSEFNFNSTGHATGRSYRQSQEFIIGSRNGRNIYGCPASVNAVMPFSNDAGEIADMIDAMTAENWTAIYMGAKWGAAMLDPSARPIVDSLIASGKLPESYAGFPRAWDDDSSRKYTVIMSDGANTRLNKVKDSEYTRPNRGPDYYHRNYHSNHIERIINNDNDGRGDALMQNICRSLRDAGENSVVYTIGFELSDGSNAATQLENCASDISTFYLVDGAGLSTAFDNIANEIVRLKLVN